MEFRNLTPFAAMQYAMLDVNDEEKHVVVMKVGYQLQPAGKGVFQARVRDDDAIGLCTEDTFTGKMNASSVREESDLAPFKPACDVIINATAWAPDGQPCASIPVRVTIKDAEHALLLSKHLHVSGVRAFRQHAVTRHWSLSEPEPFISYPLRWEGAWGGECRIDRQDATAGAVPDSARLTAEQQAQHPQALDAPLAHDACVQNPAGLGYMTPWYARAKRPEQYPAPRITCPEQPFTADDFAALIAGHADITHPQFQPAGLGTVGRAWQPRLALAGTWDDTWLEERHPGLPTDFDFRYWNGAPADQQIPYPSLPLFFSLEGLSPDGPLQFSLPNHVAFILLRMKNGLFLPQLMQIDTLHIDTERLEVSVCWRYCLPVSVPVRVMELRFETEPERLPEKIYPMLFPAGSASEKDV